MQKPEQLSWEPPRQAIDGKISTMRNLVSVRLETVLVSVQDRCTVCAEHTTGSEIILDTPDGSTT
jgi:hypothetical protein